MNKGRVIALGFFDGVHLGHGALLKRCRQEADRLGVEAAAVTFDRHPASALTGRKVPMLSTLTRREQLMKGQYAMDRLIVLPFDETLRSLPWERYLEDVLLRELKAVSLVCGWDNRFGKGGEGTPEQLRQRAERLGCGCHVVEPVEVDGIQVSSTHIRGLLTQGDVEGAARFLGYAYSITGRVVHGKALGRILGTPTANLEPEPGLLLPAKGVYACRATTRYGTYAAVTNVGERPTVSGQGLTVEPWLLDFQGDLYDTEVTLEFCHFLRPERQFPNLDALREEIHRNARQTRQLLSVPAGQSLTQG